MKERWLINACVAACFIPTFFWYGRRMLAGGEESFSVVLLPLLFLFAKKVSTRNATVDWVTLLGIALYVSCWLLSVPAILKAVLAITVLLYHFGLIRNFGISALAYLSLPWLSSLQFFLGYPLRRVVTEISGSFLRMIGLPVEAQGTGILFQNQHVFVDPPCSGVKMLWAGTIFCAILCCMFKFSWKKGVAVMFGGGLFLVLANAIRGSVLFFPESNLVSWPAWTHEGVGVLIYFLAILVFITASQKLSTKHA